MAIQPVTPSLSPSLRSTSSPNLSFFEIQLSLTKGTTYSPTLNPK